MRIDSIQIAGNEVKSFVRGKLFIKAASRDDFFPLVPAYEGFTLRLREKIGFPTISSGDIVNCYYDGNLVYTGYIDKNGHSYDHKKKIHEYYVKAAIYWLNDEVFGTLTYSSSDGTFARILNQVVAKLPGYSWSAPAIGDDILLDSIHFPLFYSVSDEELQNPSKFYVATGNPWYYSANNDKYYLKVHYYWPGSGWSIEYCDTYQSSGSGIRFVSLPGDAMNQLPPQVDIPFAGLMYAAPSTDGSCYYFIDSHEGKNYLARWNVDQTPWYVYYNPNIQYSGATLLEILADLAYMSDSIIEVANNVITLRNNTNHTIVNASGFTIHEIKDTENHLDDDVSNFEKTIVFTSNGYKFREFSLKYYYNYKYNATANKRTKRTIKASGVSNVIKVGDKIEKGSENYGIVVATKIPVNRSNMMDIETEIY
jgi:hypothetical protein